MTTPDQERTDRGWAFPGAARKAHFFRADGRSLCGEWGSFRIPAEMFDKDTTTPSPDDCAKCRRKLDREGPL